MANVQVNGTVTAQIKNVFLEITVVAREFDPTPRVLGADESDDYSEDAGIVEAADVVSDTVLAAKGFLADQFGV